MNTQLKKKLTSLADKYENSDFLKEDPSQFMHRYSSVRDKEVTAFISSSLAFGNRKQILSHIQLILDDVDKAGGKKNSSPAEYILSGKYKSFFKPADGSANMNKSFYRVFTYGNMTALFDVLKEILSQEKTLGAYFKKRYLEALTVSKENANCADTRCSAVSKENANCADTRCSAVGKENATRADTRCSAVGKENATRADIATLAVNKKYDVPEPPLYEIIRKPFLNRGCGNLIPYTKNSACKRIQLFLRWMVRDNSTVDLGLWKWYDKSNLLIPLDVHVLQESISFGLLKPAGSFAKETDSSQKITSSAKESDSSQNNNTSSKTDISLPACRSSAKETNHSIPSATIKMAKELTAQLKQIWPEDPLKGDYALFGFGVN